MPSLRVDQLVKNYGTGDMVTPVLRNVTFTIAAGEFVAIMGPSGSGKSTLMHVLGFLDHATSGRYFFDEKDVSAMTENELARMRREKVGFVFQAFFLLPELTVRENVLLPLAYHAISVAERHERAVRAIESVGLSHRLDYLATQLSGGEKQRVAIARALAGEPSVIFADEPTGNLDSASGAQVMEILERLNQQGKTIILVTHESDIAEHARRVLRIRDGVLTSDEKVTRRRNTLAGDGLQK